ncbi:MAG: polysaccharide biosynthesis tyrosine autokinase [Bacteroidales bacterium]
MEDKYPYLEEEESIDIRAFIIRNLRYWYLYVFFLVIAFFIAILVNKFSTPIYRVSAWVLIRDEENPLDMQSYVGASLYGNPYKLQNEIGILKSKELTQRALQQLDFEISYFREEKFISKEIYKNSPFIVEPDSLFEQPVGVRFSVILLNDSMISVFADAEDVVLHDYMRKTNTRILNHFEFSDTVIFGEITGNNYCRFRVLPNFNLLKEGIEHQKYSFQFNSLGQLIAKYRNFDIESSKNSSILVMSLKSSNAEKSVAFLNNLTEIYLIKGIERDNRIAENTINFIDSQLKDITDSLRTSEDRLQHFKSSKQLMNLDYQAKQVFEKFEDLQTRKADLIVKSKYYQYLKDYLVQNNDINDLIAPSSLDINDPLLNSLIMELSREYAERSEYAFNSIKDNPAIISLEAKINDIKAKLLENIENIINTSNISLSEIDTRISESEGRMSKLPKEQRELLGYERKFNLNDALYTFLLTKRSEMQISKASNLPSNELLDKAAVEDSVAVHPNKKLNYILALLLGIFFPAVLLYIKDLFRDKIADKSDIEKITKLPVIGQIIHNKHRVNNVVHEFPKSLVAESFRSLRTNFQFLGSTDENVVLITSIVTGEGKSYVAINLAAVFSQAGKKVILLDFDLRKSKLAKYLNIENAEGLSTFLSGRSKPEDLVMPSGIENLDVVLAGPVPPNPTELLASQRTIELIASLKKKYDYVIIDSPPIGMVSDALLLIRNTNVNIFVIRQGFTPKPLLSSIIHDLEKRNLNNLNLVVNDVKISSNSFGYGYGYGYAYGYGYGYGHSDAKKPFRQKIAALFTKD